MGLDLNIGALCAHTVDYNSDGWGDLVVCGDNFAGGLHIFPGTIRAGDLTDVSSAILGGPVDANDAVFVDVNHDSRPDLITLTNNTLAERLQRANGTFAQPRTILTLQSGKSPGGRPKRRQQPRPLRRRRRGSRTAPTRRTTCCWATPTAASNLSRYPKLPSARATASMRSTTTTTA